MKQVCFLLLLLMCALPCHGAYFIEGEIEYPDTQYTAYLSILTEWDDFNLVSSDMILQSSPVDSNGHFQFSGNELPEEIGFYKIHFSIAEVTPVFMSGSPLDKNYFIFLFSNTDSLTLALAETYFAAGSYSLTSTLPENTSMLKLLIETDNFELQVEEAQSEGLQKLIQETEQAFLLDYIADSDHGLLNLFALNEAKLDIKTYPEIYQRVADQLTNPAFRSTFSLSLEQHLGSTFYRGLKAHNRRLTQLLVAAGVLIVILLGLLILQFIKNRAATTEIPILKPESLTPKESELIALVAEGLTNKEIAAQLFISESTVKTHINNIYRKTGISSRSQVKAYLGKHPT